MSPESIAITSVVLVVLICVWLFRKFCKVMQRHDDVKASVLKVLDNSQRAMFISEIRDEIETSYGLACSVTDVSVSLGRLSETRKVVSQSVEGSSKKQYIINPSPVRAYA